MDMRVKQESGRKGLRQIEEPRPAAGKAQTETFQPTHRVLRFDDHRAFS